MAWILRKSAVLLTLGVVSITASPRSAIYVKYSTPAQAYSGSYRLAESRSINDNTVGSDPEAMWPIGVFLPPETWVLDDPWPSPGQKVFTDSGSKPDDYDYDPLLLTGEDAKAFVKYIYGRGELFFHDIPHARAVLRNQEERRANGLAGNRLGSNRPDSPFYLWRMRRYTRRRRQ